MMQTAWFPLLSIMLAEGTTSDIHSDTIEIHSDTSHNNPQRYHRNPQRDSTSCGIYFQGQCAAHCVFSYRESFKAHV